MDWNESNAKTVRDQLDKIIVEIKAGTFRFAKVFPKSKKANFFIEKELCLFGEIKTPDQVAFNDYAWDWYELLKDSGRVAQRTLWGYKSYLNRYLTKFFDKLTFAELNKSVFDTLYQKKSDMVVMKTHFPERLIAPVLIPLNHTPKFQDHISTKLVHN